MAESKEIVARQWLGVRELADYLGLRPATIYQYVCERRIPYHKVPGSQLVKFKVSEVDEWMARGRVESKEDYFKRSHRKKGPQDGRVTPEER